MQGNVAFASYAAPYGYSQAPNPSMPGDAGAYPPAGQPAYPPAGQPAYPPLGMAPQPGYGPPMGEPNFGPAPAAEAAPEEYLPRWTITSGAIFLHSFRSPAQMLVQNFAEGNEVIDAHDMAMQWGEGPRIDAIARYDCNWGLELLYYGISNWDRSQAVTSDSFGIPGYFVPTLTSLYVFNDVTATARMDLYNAEFNVRRDITPNITGLLGFRYLEVLDRLDLLGTFPSESAEEDSKVKNALYGLQVGADVRLFKSLGKAYLDCFVKGGVYDNYVTRTESVSGTLLSNSSVCDNSDHVAFVGEVAFLPTWDISKHFSVYGGYEALFVQGLAVASQELGSTASIRASRLGFYQGATAGLTAKW